MSTAASSTIEPPQAENERIGGLESAEGTTTSMDRRLGRWLICAGLIALASAATLVYERLQIYVDAGHTTVCDINGLWLPESLYWFGWLLYRGDDWRGNSGWGAV